MSKVNLHWTTVITEKIMLGFIGILTTVAAGLDVYDMFLARKIELADVSLPIIIAITALCRLIVLHSKDADPWVLIAEAGAILILAGAAYLISYKDWLSLEKEKIRNED